MRASEIMTTPVATVHGVDSVRYAATLLTQWRVTSMPVLDDDDRVIGIVSESDLIRDRMPADPRSHMRIDPRTQPDPHRLVRDVMTDTVFCMGPSADTADLAALMLDSNVRAVPITEGAQLLGIVSRRDLLRTLLRDDQSVQRDVRLLLDDYAGESGRWSVNVEDGVVTVGGRFEDSAAEECVTVLTRSVPGVVRVHLHSR